MESHSSVTLFLLTLCLAFSVGRARPQPAASPRLAPTGGPAASPRLAPIGGPAASPWPFPSEDFFEGDGSNSPEGSVVMNDLSAQFNGPSANDAVSEAAKYVSELGDDMAPAASAAMDKVAAMGPAASAAMHKAGASIESVGDALAPAASAAKDKIAAMGPAASAAMHKAAAWAAELKSPSPK